MTGLGTNTYILGRRHAVVIDPGPADPDHLKAILRLVAQIGPLRHILVTHSHLDHSALARNLSDATGAEILAFGDSLAGRSDQMTLLAQQGLSGGGEGVDRDFSPHRTLADDAALEHEGHTIRAIWTPGHFGNHMCFHWRDGVFSGDHVMGWASSLISPPDGDLGAYMRSLDRLEGVGSRRLYPGHGDIVEDPARRIAELRHHRLAREAAIRDCLARAPHRIDQLVAQIYADTPQALHAAAGRNVFAHLLDLAARGLVECAPDLRPEATFWLLRTDL